MSANLALIGGNPNSMKNRLKQQQLAARMRLTGKYNSFNTNSNNKR